MHFRWKEPWTEFDDPIATSRFIDSLLQALKDTSRKETLWRFCQRGLYLFAHKKLVTTDIYHF